MRVQAGKFKGRLLCPFKADFIRPMTDRVKNSLFNTLGPNFDKSFPFVLDLFSGTGALAIESLSRGAHYVLCVDRSWKSQKIFQKNQHSLKIKTGIYFRRQDVFAFLNTYAGRAFDLILADPPFAKQLAGRILRAVLKSCVLKANSIFIVETAIRENIPSEKENLIFAKKEFGDKRLLFYRF